MAKISARGDREECRWTKPDGSILVLTKNGRLLRRMRLSGYTLVTHPRRKWDRQTAGAQAATWGYTYAGRRG
jgi:hypothetical protein